MGADRPSPPSWSAFFAARREVHARWGAVWSVPRLRKRSALICRELAPGLRVLDVGGGEREWEGRLRQAAPGLVYRAVEIDPERRGDFATLDEAEKEGPFDLALMLEVIEHLPFEEGIRMLSQIRRALAPGGRLVVSTPNAHHPTRFLEDATHRTPFTYECLGGALILAGFRLEGIWRAYNASILERAVRCAAVPLHRLLGIDYARTLFAVGRK